MSHEHLTRINTEHQAWLKGLDFYKDDLKILENRLLEIASRNTGFEVSRGVEHFQNQFLIQRNNIDEIRHSIREHMASYGRSVAGGEASGASGHALVHQELAEGYVAFEKVMNDLRHEFNAFLAKWM